MKDFSHSRFHHVYLTVIIIIGRLRSGKAISLPKPTHWYLASDCIPQPDQPAVHTEQGQVLVALTDLEEPPERDAQAAGDTSSAHSATATKPSPGLPRPGPLGTLEEPGLGTHEV